MTTRPDILCIGSVLWDIIGRTADQMPPGGDLPGRIRRGPGGVARNIAMTLRRFGLTPAMLSAVGRDAEGQALVNECSRMGLITDHILRPDDLPTDRYMAIEGPGGLVAAVADAHTLEAVGGRILLPLSDGRLGAPDRPWRGPVAIDGNLTAALLADITASPLFAEADLRVAPASPGKAERLLPLLSHPRATLYVNLEEAGILCQTRFADAAGAAEGLMVRGASRVVVTDGARLCADGRAGEPVLTDRPPEVPVARVTGAGDSFMAAHLVAELRGADRQAALGAALRAAADHVSKDVPA
jgi:sugar/nucleoside kinase (ribokinase family)